VSLVSRDPEDADQNIIERVRTIAFSCIYCDTRNPAQLSAVEYKPKGSGPHATGFFICPECRNKFLVKIEDLGKVR
jgi:hypothetical protein